MAGFIVGACLIDTMAGFSAGVDEKTSRNNGGNRFKTFVRSYLRSYDAETLYHDLRCGLVHSFSDGDTYWFCGRGSFTHLAQHDGKTIIVLSNFYDDLNGAFNALKAKILNDEDCFNKAKVRLLSMGVILRTM